MLELKSQAAAPAKFTVSRQPLCDSMVPSSACRWLMLQMKSVDRWNMMQVLQVMCPELTTSALDRVGLLHFHWLALTLKVGFSNRVICCRPPWNLWHAEA